MMVNDAHPHKRGLVILLMCQGGSATHILANGALWFCKRVIVCQVAPIGDGATLSPFSVPAAVSFTVVVTYADGSTKVSLAMPR